MFTDPVKNLKAFDLREDMIVADLGAGTGHYVLPLAKILSRGKVYAVEIQKDFLIDIKNKGIEAHLSNIECLLGNVEKAGGTKLKDGILDRVVASNILFQVEDKESFIKEVKRILKPKGKVLLIDWLDNKSIAPPGLDKIILKDKAIEMFKQEGFVLEREIDTGGHHYGIIFIKGR